MYLHFAHFFGPLLSPIAVVFAVWWKYLSNCGWFYIDNFSVFWSIIPKGTKLDDFFSSLRSSQQTPHSRSWRVFDPLFLPGPKKMRLSHEATICLFSRVNGPFALKFSTTRDNRTQFHISKGDPPFLTCTLPRKVRFALSVGRSVQHPKNPKYPRLKRFSPFPKSLFPSLFPPPDGRARYCIKIGSLGSV